MWPAPEARFTGIEARFTANEARFTSIAARSLNNDTRFSANVASLYGEPFAAALSAPPVSAFYADGSPVTVYRGQRLAADLAEGVAASRSRRNVRHC